MRNVWEVIENLVLHERFFRVGRRRDGDRKGFFSGANNVVLRGGSVMECFVRIQLINKLVRCLLERYSIEDL